MSAYPDQKTPAQTRVETPSEPGRPQQALEAYCLEFDYLCRSFQRLGVRESDVEDLAHEVFLILSRKWQDYDASRPLRPYLFGIVFRVASQHRRRHQREIPSEIPEVADTQAQPDQVLSNAQTRALVIEVLERIPLQRRAVFVMHDIDETPMRIIAKTLQIPLFTAYSRLRKARQEFERWVMILQRGAR